MSITEHTCFRVTCNTCTAPFTDCEGYEISFASRGQVDKDLPEVGWTVDGETVECKSCGDARACRETGHVWESWHACKCGCANGSARIPDHTVPTAVRHCDRCWHPEYRPPNQGRAS